jgi:hypothetical protein
LTAGGRAAIDQHWQQLDALRTNARSWTPEE